MFPVFSSPWFDSGYMLGLRGLLASTLQELRILCSCSSSVVDILFVPQKLIPMVQSAQQIMEILQLLLFLVVDVPVVLGRASSQVLPWRRPWRSHSCSSLRNQTLSTTLRIWLSLVWCSPVEYRIMDFSGENFQICRIQCFLVQQWIHVYVSLRRRVSCW